MNEFDKIIGYESEKEELVRLCDTLKNRAKYAKLGMNMPQTLLLYGPSGVGKTLMAKAFIAESKRKVFYCKKDKSDGEFIAAIKDTFAEAKKKAPSIIFFDDMDKFAEDNLNQNCNKEEFVAIQSGLEDIRGANVFVIATANDICNLPNSLLRAGRFGRQIHVEVPDYDDSVKIIEHYLTGKNVAEDVHAELLARTLQGKSCAVLEEIMNEAAMYAGFDEEAEKICLEHVEKAIPRVLFKTIPEREKNGRARELAAYHEAGHALVAFQKSKTYAMFPSITTGCTAAYVSAKKVTVRTILKRSITKFSFRLQERRRSNCNSESLPLVRTAIWNRHGIRCETMWKRLLCMALSIVTIHYALNITVLLRSSIKVMTG